MVGELKGGKREGRWFDAGYSQPGDSMGIPYLDIPDAHATVHPRGAELGALVLPTRQH